MSFCQKPSLKMKKIIFFFQQLYNSCTTVVQQFYNSCTTLFQVQSKFNLLQESYQGYVNYLDDITSMITLLKV